MTSFKVALLIESSRTYGRGTLRGIAKYAHLRGQWSCFAEERELHSGFPAWPNAFSWHQMIEMALARHIKVILLTPTPDLTARRSGI